MIFLWCLPAKITPICDFWSCNAGVGWGYQVLWNYHNCQVTLYTLQWPKTAVAPCHLSWDIVSLLFRCQIPVFSHLLLLKSAIFSLYLSKAFQLPIVSFLFRNSQIPDLTLSFTPNLLRSMFAYHLFLIWHCFLEITEKFLHTVTAGSSSARLRWQI